MLLALFNASVMTGLSRIQSDAVRIKFEVGLVERTPFPLVDAAEAVDLARLARRAWSLKRSLDTRTEASHAFMLPALLQVDGETITARAVAWAERVHASESELAAIQAEIDARCFDLYGIDEADRRAITDGFGVCIDASGGMTDADPDAEGVTDAEPEVESEADASALVRELMSWAVGVAVGRFDVRLAIGSRGLPDEPDPFDPLPVCSPAMLADDDGWPLSSAPTGYPLAFPETGILVDDVGHPQDLTAAVRAVFDLVFGTDADTWWGEAAAQLDSKDHDLRTWLSSSFFEHHLKRHSKSRRKAPVMWHLGIPSGRFGVWIYAHRLTRDSFFQIQNDIVAPKLAHEERRLTSLGEAAGGDFSPLERKELALQQGFVDELRALLDDIKLVTPLWNPTLDDGVVLTMAPLWRLVPQYRVWQKELKTKWDEIASGTYDWAHLSMHLWPERVVPECARDRSLAIAHGLEDAFWVEGTDGKWTARSAPTRPTEELVREHASPAVKAALNSLLDAPAASAGSGRSRGRRAASAAGRGGAR